MDNEERLIDCFGIMDELNVGSDAGESCYMRDGHGNQNTRVNGVQPGETVMQPLIVGEALQDTFVGGNNEIYTLDAEAKMIGDAYQCAGVQGVPYPTRDVNMGLNAESGFIGVVVSTNGNMGLNAESGFVGELASINGIGNKGTGSDDATSIEVVGFNGFQSRVSQGQLLASQPAYVEEKDIEHVALIPRSREEESTREEEGEFYVNDLVWGKVRGHPWWPGQIFEPSSASQKAMKYFKRDSYLVAYFGDQTFAWNEVAQIKPFRLYFNHMEKQSYVDAFCHAVDCSLDEVSRRVEFGLSCTCVPKEVQHKLKSQIVVNAGIRAESSQRDGGDKLSTLSSFRPGVLLQHLKSMAKSPCCVVDKLGFVVARSQLLAFSRWKGYYELPSVESFCGLEGSVQGWNGNFSVPSGKEKSTIINSSSRKRGRPKKFLHIGQRIQRAAVQLGGSTVVIKSGAEFINLDAVLANLSMAAKDPINGYDVLGPYTDFFSCLREFTSLKSSKLNDHEIKVKHCSGKSLSVHGIPESSALDGTGDSYWTDRIIQGNFEEQVFYEPENQDEKNAPVGQSDDFVGFNPNANEQERSVIFMQSSEAEDPSGIFDGQRILEELFEPETQIEYKQERDAMFMQSEAEDHPSGIFDGQWILEDQVFLEPETQVDQNIPIGLDPDAETQERDAMIMQSEAEGLSGSAEGEAEEEDSPTALILNFKNLESVPSATDLNNVFGRFGPLDESQTEGMHKTKRAKVVFKRRSNAETAFNSAGKYRIFGPSLISYRLNYAPRPRKVPVSTRKRKKTASTENDDI